MNSKQLRKTWAFALVLPVFSIAVATAAVAFQDDGSPHQDYDSEDYNSGLRQYHQTENSLRPKQATTTNTNWRRLRYQDQDNEALPGIQDPFGNQAPLGNPQDDINPPLGQQQPSGRNFAVPLRPEKVKQDLSGWQTASANDGRLGTELRGSWVSLDINGILHGSVYSPGEEQISKVFILEGGQLVASVDTDANGSFLIEGLTAGVYTFVSYSKSSFAVTGFIALKHDPANDYPQSIDITALPRDAFLVASIVKNISPEVTFRVYELYDVGQEAADPTHLYGLTGLTAHHPSASPSNSIQAQPVQLHNGRMVGRVRQLDPVTGRPIDMRNTVVRLIQDGQVVAETQVDNYGVFEISDLSPGYYGVIAGGADGLGALGVELVESGSESADDLDASNRLRTGVRQVSHASRNLNLRNAQSFDLTLGMTESTGWINNYITEQSYLEAINTPLPQPNGPAPPMNFDPSMLYTNQGQLGGSQFFNGVMGELQGIGTGIDTIGRLAVPVGIGAIIVESVDDSDGGIQPASPFRN